MSKHTPTPWEIGSSKRSVISSNPANPKVIARMNFAGLGHGIYFDDEPEANAQRIVTCVNACEGIDNPAEYIERLKQMYKTAYQGSEDRDKKIQALLEYNAKLFAQLDALVKLTETVPSLTFTPEYRDAAFTVRTTCEHSDAAQDEPEFETPEPGI